jgi:hypothetical protein
MVKKKVVKGTHARYESLSQKRITGGSDSSSHLSRTQKQHSASQRIERALKPKKQSRGTKS